jgi:hypothetical protein
LRPQDPFIHSRFATNQSQTNFFSAEASAEPEIIHIKYPGQRTDAIDVGYCGQYDNEVFLGMDGRIYLVDSEQLKRVAPVSEGQKVYESDMKLDPIWMIFALEK